MSSGAHSRGWFRPGYGRCRPKHRRHTPESEVSSTPRLIDSITGVSGILDHPLSRAMTAESVARSYTMHCHGFNFQTVTTIQV